MGQEDGDLAERAAYLLRGIIRGHPFVDGNKRTGFEASQVFLQMNGWTTEAPPGQYIGFVRRVARGGSVHRTQNWIRSRLRKI